MAKAKAGDSVRVHYKGTLEDGTEFDSSEGRDPLVFTLGEGQVIPGFEEAIEGMDEGATKKVKIASKEAYGPRHDELVMEMDRDRMPDDVTVEVGEVYMVGNEEGQTMPVKVTAMDDKTVTLDANHPLAGKDLNFELELVEIL